MRTCCIKKDITHKKSLFQYTKITAWLFSIGSSDKNVLQLCFIYCWGDRNRYF